MSGIEGSSDGKSLVHARHARFRVAALSAGAVAALMGVAFLGAWLLGFMAARGTSGITIKTNTALCLLLAGLALVLLATEQIGPARRWLGRLCAAATLLLGALTLSEHVVGWDLGIDQLLAKEPPGALGMLSPNRMGPPGSLGFTLAGLAMLMLDCCGKRTCLLAQSLALGVCLIASFGVIGYLYEVQQLYGLARYTTIAWTTAVGLLLLGVGLLCARPDRGLMTLVTADDPGGALVRRLLLPSLLLVVLLGWLGLQGERLGLHDRALGTGLLVLCFLAFFSGLLYYGGASLSRAARAERTAEAILRAAQKQAEEQLRQLAQFPEENPNPVLRVADDGTLLYANLAATEKLTRMGWRAGQPVPTPIRLLVQRAWGSGVDVEKELECGEGRTISFLVTPIANAGYVNLYGRDVTDARRAEAALREREGLLRLALTAAQMGTWDYDPVTGSVSCDQRTQAIFGGGPPERSNWQVILKRIHPEDAPRMDAAMRRALEPTSDGMYTAEYRVVWPDGSTHWVQADAQTVLAGEGPDRRAVRMVGTVKDITDRKRVEEELVAAKQSAERATAIAELANRAKDHFLAVLSHELRTPLTPVVMGVSMLQDRSDLTSETRETLEMVRRNVEMEARLIDDLLDVTRIARGKIELTRRPVELCTVIQRAVEVCKPDIDARGLRFGVDIGPAAPYWVEADVPRLQQVFWNLLKNAIKFTPHGGHVGILCRLNEEHVVVEVNDSGIGIEPEALSRVFNAFEQAERSITRQFGGLGLGLAISKALVEMHGGKIEAHSEGRDKGATFRVRLPLTAPAGQPEPPTLASPPGVIRPLRILLVEDHGVTAKMMRKLLTAEGHAVETADDVATALELAGRQPFDLLLSDLGLPDGSGHDLLRELRARGHKFPGIALSGYGQEDDIHRSYEAGFATHLTKPASREAIFEAVASVTPGRAPHGD